ncbi:hypothetical protein AVEN_82988-1 [Araneus ventricosus]|uniref:Uncharacterized protein n=1 Tax=Araneus ventricosus TaxID=182803 RepID=A0A4Y2GNN0_ARAVE|nr:hypothetical protein AVEN_82988-1 [Araneus ventricosus]
MHLIRAMEDKFEKLFAMIAEMRSRQEEMKFQFQGVDGIIEEINDGIQRKIERINDKVQRKIEEGEAKVQGEIGDIEMRLN